MRIRKVQRNYESNNPDFKFKLRDLVVILEYYLIFFLILIFILFIYLFIYLFIVFLPFLGLLQRHMEVPRLGVESEL